MFFANGYFQNYSVKTFRVVGLGARKSFRRAGMPSCRQTQSRRAAKNVENQKFRIFRPFLIENFDHFFVCFW